MKEEKIICDICGKDVGVNSEQNLFKEGFLGRTDVWDTCLDCTKKLSKYAQKLREEAGNNHLDNIRQEHQGEGQ